MHVYVRTDSSDDTAPFGARHGKYERTHIRQMPHAAPNMSLCFASHDRILILIYLLLSMVATGILAFIGQSEGIHTLVVQNT